jgi:hypothetical protein
VVPTDTGSERFDYNRHKNPLDTVPPGLEAFVPEGYEILDTASGDLNRDAFTDMILVLSRIGEEKASDEDDNSGDRPLLVLTGTAGGAYRLAARGDNAVYCINCGGMMGDPFMGIVINRGYFSVEHYGGSGWRWSRTITFKYVPEEQSWYLHKDGGESFHVDDPEKVKEHVKTTKDFGRVPLAQFDIYKED